LIGPDQAIVAARCGADVVMIGRLGNDVGGAEFPRCVRGRGVDSTVQKLIADQWA